MKHTPGVRSANAVEHWSIRCVQLGLDCDLITRLCVMPLILTSCVWAHTPEERNSEPCVKQLIPSLGLRTPSLLAALQRFSEESIHQIQTVQRNLELQKLKSVGLWDFFLFVSFCFLFFPWSGAVRLELNWENMNGVCSMFAETLGRFPSGYMVTITHISGWSSKRSS